MSTFIGNECTILYDFHFQVRSQHLERTVDFLVKELKVCTQKEAQERIFFVSAKEALQARLCEQKGQPTHSKLFLKHFRSYLDFERYIFNTKC